MLSVSAFAGVQIDPQNMIPTNLLNEALDRYEEMNLNSTYLGIADMSQSSRKKRFFLVNLDTGKVERFYVSHGRGSDPENVGYARQFSDQEGSNATSLGFYLTTSTYQGKHGLSLRLRGLDQTNRSAEQRAVVMHGATYVSEGHTGRSLGCPAFSEKDAPYIIDRLKNGSLLYVGLSQGN